MKIYLAGIVGGPIEPSNLWRTKIMEHFNPSQWPHVSWLIPHPWSTGTADPYCAYFAWDVYLLQQADLVVAYLNPGDDPRTGTAWEMGYAYAERKSVILIDGRKEDTRYGFIKKAATYVINSLDEAVGIIRCILTGNSEA